MVDSPYDWLRYSTAGKTRSLPLNENLLQAFESYVPQLGIELEVFSGGQTSNRDPALEGAPGGWTGSVRHNDGNAADVYLHRDGRRLSSDNPEDRAIMAEFITQSRRAGLTGIGHAPDYMGTAGIHVGYGTPAVWGSRGRSANTPDWVRGAYDAGAQPVNYSTGTPAPSGTFREAITQSESSGNPTAYNDLPGAGGHRGHGGLLQFGTARLADAARAGVIPRMTAAEFAQQPEEVQNRVGDWHFNDINEQIERRGLNQYYGQTVGGVPVTQSSIQAMAHLGGIGGASRFLESGGSYNPADDYGTRLSDYGQRFANMDEEPRSREGAEGPARSLDFDSVLSSDFLRRNSDPNGTENTALSYSRALMMRYDNAIRNQEDLFGYAQNSKALTFGALMPDIKDTPEYQQIFPPGTPLPTTANVDDQEGPVGAPSPRRREQPSPDEVAAAMQRGAGSEVLGGGQGEDTLAARMSTSDSPWGLGEPVSEARLAAPAQAAQAAELVRGAMPQSAAPAPAPERDMAGFLQALGVGFGQLAANEPINIGGVMQQRLQNKMAQEAAELEQQRWEEQQARQARMDRLQERRFALDEARLGLDERKFQAEAAGNQPTRVNFGLLDGLAQDNPNLSRAIQAAQIAQETGDIETRDILLGGIETALPQLYEAAEVVSEYGDDFPNRVELLSRAASIGDTDPEAANELTAQAFEGVNDDGFERLTEISNRFQSPSTRNAIDIQLADWDRINPDATPEERYAKREELYMVANGVPTERMARIAADQQIASDMQSANSQLVLDTRARYAEGARTAAQLVPTLNRAETAVDTILANSDSPGLSAATGPLNSMARAASTVVAGILPSTEYSTPVDWLVGNGVIDDAEAFQNLEGAAQQLSLIITRQLMEGQGSVTDEERRNVMRALIGSDQSAEVIKSSLQQLRALGQIDIAMNEVWNDLVPTLPTSVREQDRAVQATQVAQRLEEVARNTVASSARDLAMHDLSTLHFERENGRLMTAQEQTDHDYAMVSLLPQLAPSEASIFRDALTANFAEPPENNPHMRMPKVFLNSETLRVQGATMEDALSVLIEDPDTGEVRVQSITFAQLRGITDEED